MAKNDKNVFKSGKSQVFMVAPEDLTMITNEEHALYDPRVNEKPDPMMVANIKFNGVIEPIVIAKDGPKGIVVDGRRRVINALQANKELKKAGEPLIKIPCYVRKGNDASLAGAMISTNEQRKDDNPLSKAEKLERYLNTGGDEDSAMTHFGVSKATIKSWLRITDLAAPVKKAVADGRISASAAARLSALTKEEQAEKLKELIEKAGGKKPTAKAAEAGARGGSVNKQKMRRRSEIEAMAEIAEDTILEDIFSWLMGKVEDIDWSQYGIEFEEEEEETEEEEVIYDGNEDDDDEEEGE